MALLVITATVLLIWISTSSVSVEDPGRCLLFLHFLLLPSSPSCSELLSSSVSIFLFSSLFFGVLLTLFFYSGSSSTFSSSSFSFLSSFSPVLFASKPYQVAKTATWKERHLLHPRTKIGWMPAWRCGQKKAADLVRGTNRWKERNVGKTRVASRVRGHKKIRKCLPTFAKYMNAKQRN